MPARTGTYAWHMVAPAVFEVCRTNNDSTAAHMVKALKPAQDFWPRTAGRWEPGR